MCTFPCSVHVMPRKPLDSEHETVTCTVRLTKRTRDQLDEMRGKTSRSEWLRYLIEQAVASDHAWWEKLPTVVDEPTRGKSVKIIPEKRHLHRFKRGEELKRVKGIPIYHYACDCGATKEDT